MARRTPKKPRHIAPNRATYRMVAKPGNRPRSRTANHKSPSPPPHRLDRGTKWPKMAHRLAIYCSVPFFGFLRKIAQVPFGSAPRRLNPGQIAQPQFHELRTFLGSGMRLPSNQSRSRILLKFPGAEVASGC
jgi:hypothetical protein